MYNLNKKQYGQKRLSVGPLMLAVLFGISSGPVSASPFDVAQSPLFLGGVVDPNIMYIQDDSGSMGFAYMPDAVGSYRSSAYSYSIKARDGKTNITTYPLFMSSSFNRQFYDPNINYKVPVKSDGTSLGNASFTNAWRDGYDLATRASYTRDLRIASVSISTTSPYTSETMANGTRNDASSQYAIPFHYYVYNSSAPGCTATKSPVASAIPVHIGSAASYAYNPNCYVGVDLTNASAALQTNYANWYSYYRFRNYASRAGISLAFVELGGNMRVGYGRINKSTPKTIDGKSVTTVERGVRPFQDFSNDTIYGSLKSKGDFWTWLFKTPMSGGTPLRRALDAAGQYYENNANDGPWSENPGVASTKPLVACRKSFTILMTDGGWNSGSDPADTLDAQANVDGTGGPTITGPNGATFTYKAVSPFSDNWSATLADVAMHYWKRDLLTGIDNKVPTTADDPAFWQHMVTHSVGLGVTGNVNPNLALNAVITGTPTITWGDPTSGGDGIPAKTDDLLHAAVNGRGSFFSAGNPEEFAASLKSILSKITAEVGSTTGLAANAGSAGTDTVVYQAKYDTSNWSGQLLAFKLDPDTGGAVSPALWDASTQIPAFGSRNIHTFKPGAVAPAGTGVAFQWAQLSTAQQALLNNDSTLLNYLRGDTSKEASGVFRSRAGKKLGDIANSDPVYVGADDYGYGSAAGLSSAQRDAYNARKASLKTRTAMVYAGANDGMLHGFNAGNGAEIMAYVPNAVMANLKNLADPKYAHQFYVDGPAKAADAYIKGGWKTILVGSTGAGGKAYFGLDVEVPGSFSASNVLWEFTDPELGTAIGQASIGLANNGKWVAIFGNGYNSTSKAAQLFVVDLETGALLSRITTQPSATPVATVDNGLSIPVVVDVDRDGVIDAVYAGDMVGNLWKFDLSSTSASNWKVAFGSATAPVPLLKVADSLGLAQPITSKPMVKFDPASGGVMVYVGTGQFFEIGDPGVKDIQSIYGVLDPCGKASGCNKGGVTRTSLVQQTITYEGTDIRILSKNPVDYTTKRGFYLDLAYGGNKTGERVISTGSVDWGDRVIFATLGLDGDVCSFGSYQWLMEFDPFTGGRTNFSVFDLNNDKSFDQGDYYNGIPVSGTKISGGTGRFTGDPKNERKLTGKKDGSVLATANKPSSSEGRQSWRQIR